MGFFRVLMAFLTEQGKGPRNVGPPTADDPLAGLTEQQKTMVNDWAEAKQVSPEEARAQLHLTPGTDASDE